MASSAGNTSTPPAWQTRSGLGWWGAETYFTWITHARKGGRGRTGVTDGREAADGETTR